MRAGSAKADTWMPCARGNLLDKLRSLELLILGSKIRSSQQHHSRRAVVRAKEATRAEAKAKGKEPSPVTAIVAVAGVTAVPLAGS